MSSLKRNISSGVFYTAIAKYSGIVVTIVVGAILARLLTPADFGIVAIVTVFTTFFNNLGDMGLGPAIIQNQSLEKEDINSVFSFSLVIGGILALLFFLLAIPIANFYEIENLVVVSRWLAVAVFFYAVQSVPKSLMLKKMLFKQVAIITIGVQVVSSVIAIVLAYQGWGYFALVAKSVADALLLFLIFYLKNKVAVTKIRKSAISKIFRFSSFQFSFNFINYFSRNSDNFLIGKYMSVITLGYYDIAYRLMMMPIQNLTHVITPVLLPALAEHQADKEKVYNAYVILVKILAIIGFPLSVFLYFSAEPIITLLYGNQWGQSIPIFQILALTIGVQMLLSSTGALFQVVGRTDLLFYSGLLSSVFMVGGICYGVFIGKDLMSVGYGLLVAFTVNFFQGFYFLITMALEKMFLQFLKVFSLPVISTLILFVLNRGIQNILSEHLILNLIINSLLFGMVLWGTLLLDEEFKNELKKILKR